MKVALARSIKKNTFPNNK